MNRQKLLLQSVRVASLIGGVLALYISLTTFWQMSHDWWLALHNLLVVTSLVLAAYVGYQHRALAVSFKFMLLSVVVFFSVMMFLYIGSYVLTTALFADRMVWIPFFHHDYNYHGFTSVAAYLNHGNNFRELLELHIFSFLLCSVMYIAAGSSGYGAKAMIEGMKKSSGRTQSAG